MNYDEAERAVKPLLSNEEYLLSNEEYGNQAELVALNNDELNGDGAGNESLPYGNTNNATSFPQTQIPTQTQIQSQAQSQALNQVQSQTQTQTYSQNQSKNMTRPTSSTSPNNGGQQPSSNTATYPVVEVIAPATLSAGYTFDAMVDGRVLTVVVPRGGVSEGQIFEAQTRAPLDESPEFLSVPQGFWKDGLFDFCRFGPKHPSICLAFWCPLVALGQITTRLGLKWDGEPATKPSQIRFTFNLFVLLTVVHMFLRSWPTLIFATYVVLVVARVRSHMRRRYDLPPTTKGLVRHDDPMWGTCGLGGGFSEDRYVVEDYCLPLVCLPCTISQMSRHTAMYETYEGVYCSSTGLPPHVPLVV